MTISKPEADQTLRDQAFRALKNAYAPYTEIRSGLAIRLANGAIYSGCSFENAAFMHGVEPLEGAVGRALIEERWASKGVMPVITELYYSFEEKPAAPEGFYPGPLSLMLLRLWADKDATISYATSKGVFATHRAGDLITLPLPSISAENFSGEADNRSHITSSGIFADSPLKELFETRLQAFCPISHYAVGAMVETESGGRFFGCNIEPGGNKGIHAEGVALATMVDQEGPRARISRVTILTGGRPGFPCGGCRQQINEFATEDTEIICMNLEGEAITSRHSDLLPNSFGRLDLGLED